MRFPRGGGGGRPAGSAPPTSSNLCEAVRTLSFFLIFFVSSSPQESRSMLALSALMRVPLELSTVCRPGSEEPHMCACRKQKPVGPTLYAGSCAHSEFALASRRAVALFYALLLKCLFFPDGLEPCAASLSPGERSSGARRPFLPDMVDHLDVICKSWQMAGSVIGVDSFKGFCVRRYLSLSFSLPSIPLSCLSLGLSHSRCLIQYPHISLIACLSAPQRTD